jgi:hypothetical protein
VTSKPAAVVRTTIETESDVFVMPSLPLVECERRRCYVLVCAKGIHKLNPAYAFNVGRSGPQLPVARTRAIRLPRMHIAAVEPGCFVEGNMRRAVVRSPAGTAPAFFTLVASVRADAFARASAGLRESRSSLRLCLSFVEFNARSVKGLNTAMR